MLCEGCQKQRATVFITCIVHGETVRFDLCPECAGPLPDDIPRHDAHISRSGLKIPADPERPREIQLPATITVHELASILRIRPFMVIGCLLELNVFASINSEIDFSAAADVCARCEVVARKAD